MPSKIWLYIKTHSPLQNIVLLFYTACILGGLWFAVTAAAFGISTFGWPKVSAEITNIVYHSGLMRWSLPQHYEAYYQYNVDGKIHTGSDITGFFSFRSPYSPGQIIEIYYNPAQTTQSVLHPGIGFAFGGLLFSFISYLVFMMRYRKI